MLYDLCCLYTVSQMDGDHYVPVSVIAGFLKVMKVTNQHIVTTVRKDDTSLVSLCKSPCCLPSV